MFKEMCVPFAAVALTVSVPIAGRAQTPPKKAAAGAGVSVSRKFVPPKTPWGDPDISGNFTTKDEANTPFERPDEFAGKRIEDITPEELAAVVKARQQEAVEGAPFLTGSRTNGIAIGVPIHWLDHLDAVNSRPWFVVDPPDGKIPPLSEAGKQRAAAVTAARAQRGTADSYTDRWTGDRCIAWGIGVARVVPGVYGNSHQILQTKGYVAIRYEMVHETRIIPIEGRGAARPHTPASLPSSYGDATARWEGNTLVVDTVNYDGKIGYRGSAQGLHTIERFTRVAPNKLEWSATIEDPTTWTRPWTFAIPWTEDDTQMIHEYACHEGNYGIRNILAGARSDEKRGIVPSDGPAVPPEQQE